MTLNPTSAQVHVALATLRTLKGLSGDVIDSFTMNTTRKKMLDTISYIMDSEGWTGATETCEAFGVAAEKSEGEIARLSEMVAGLSAQNAEIGEFLNSLASNTRTPDAVNVKAIALMEKFGIPRH